MKRLKNLLIDGSSMVDPITWWSGKLSSIETEFQNSESNPFDYQDALCAQLSKSQNHITNWVRNSA